MASCSSPAIFAELFFHLIALIIIIKRLHRTSPAIQCWAQIRPFWDLGLNWLLPNFPKKCASVLVSDLQFAEILFWQGICPGSLRFRLLFIELSFLPLPSITFVQPNTSVLPVIQTSLRFLRAKLSDIDRLKLIGSFVKPPIQLFKKFVVVFLFSFLPLLIFG